MIAPGGKPPTAIRAGSIPEFGGMGAGIGDGRRHILGGREQGIEQLGAAGIVEQGQAHRARTTSEPGHQQPGWSAAGAVASPPGQGHGRGLILGREAVFDGRQT